MTDERRQNTIIRAGMWLAALVGSAWGLIMHIGGHLFDWGPGGSMEGPSWMIILTGIASILIGSYVGELIFRKLAGKIRGKDLSVLVSAIVLFFIMAMASMVAFIAGWETGYLLGKVTGTISGLEWKVVLFAVPLMSFIYGIPVCLAAGLIYTAFALLYLRRGSFSKSPITNNQ